MTKPNLTCEEASPMSANFYIPCGQPAVAVVDHGRGEGEYLMCEACADHNVRNRGGTSRPIKDGDKNREDLK